MQNPKVIAGFKNLAMLRSTKKYADALLCLSLQTANTANLSENPPDTSLQGGPP
jgi:hypothetical protein